MSIYSVPSLWYDEKPWTLWFTIRKISTAFIRENISIAASSSKNKNEQRWKLFAGDVLLFHFFFLFYICWISLRVAVSSPKESSLVRFQGHIHDRGERVFKSHFLRVRFIGWQQPFLLIPSLPLFLVRYHSPKSFIRMEIRMDGGD